MARPLRIEYPDACYLISLQGTEGLGLFVEPEDARHFQDLMRISGEKHRAVLHAYGLAQNSALLLVQTPEANLGLYLQGILTAFARHIRHHYVHKGPIMDGRYHARLVEPGRPLRNAAEWVHGHPVRDRDEVRTAAQKRRFLDRHPFSSFRQTAGMDPEGPADPTQVLRAYGSPASKRPARHAEAVRASVEENRNAGEVLGPASRLAIGSETFQNDVAATQNRLQAGKRVKGVKSYGTKTRGVARNRIVDALAGTLGVDRSEFFRHRHDSPLRPALAFFLYRYSGMTQQEIADFIGVGSAAAVSLQMKRLMEKRASEPEFDQTMQAVEKTLNAGRSSGL